MVLVLLQMVTSGLLKTEGSLQRPDTGRGGRVQYLKGFLLAKSQQCSTYTTDPRTGLSFKMLLHCDNGTQLHTVGKWQHYAMLRW
uniref:Lipocalin n=1 Tax=Rhipicephalus appendiculatus TaxID=34631 RepID=A0A131YDR0_RHIAP